MRKFILLFFITKVCFPLVAQEKPDWLKTPVDLQVSALKFEQALQVIENRFDIHFSYNPLHIPVAEAVSLQWHQVPLGVAFDSLFSPYGLQYQCRGRHVIITPNAPAEAAARAVYILRGQVLSKPGAEPVPLAHIYIKQDLVGVVSNYEGYF
ncbi:MAG: hypothetical protein HC880_11340 [Bacteroidia bacterium]|nr:hypothetical protein [Bacteroidia bacterium]